MASPASFVASPGKRIAAFIFDCFAATLLYLVAVAVGEPLGQDLSTFRAFLVVYFIYQFAFVAFRHGSTPGKEVQSIYVLSSTGQAPSQWQSLLRASVRLALLGILTIELREWVLPEALIKFSCLTGFGLLVLADLALLHNSPTRQTVTDRIAGTLVVNLPSPEPHRAPAAPMYSATDDEFGTPPKVGPKHGGRSETYPFLQADPPTAVRLSQTLGVRSMNLPVVPTAMLLGVVPAVVLLVFAKWRLAKSRPYKIVAVLALAVGIALIATSLATAVTYTFLPFQVVRESRWFLAIPLALYAFSALSFGRSQKIETPSLVIGALVGLIPLSFLGLYTMLLSSCSYGDCL